MNEVGGDPDCDGVTLEDFHDVQREDAATLSRTR